MNPEIRLTNRARRELRRIAKSDAGRILSALELYAETGRGDIRPLRGTNNVRRLRLGDYRAFFVVNRIEHRIEVISVRHRREAYR